MEKKVMNAKLNDVNGKGNAHMFIESDGAELNMPENFVGDGNEGMFLFQKQMQN